MSNNARKLNQAEETRTSLLQEEILLRPDSKFPGRISQGNMKFTENVSRFVTGGRDTKYVNVLKFILLLFHWFNDLAKVKLVHIGRRLASIFCRLLLGCVNYSRVCLTLSGPGAQCAPAVVLYYLHTFIYKDVYFWADFCWLFG